jgi:aminomethyltransferase
MTDLRHTPLHDLHARHGARFAPFAGYEMPLRYEAGAIAEHRWTRGSAGLFDVSHMGVLEVVGDDAAGALERAVPSDLVGLAPGRSRYTVLLTDRGGIADDLIVTRIDEHTFQLVVNAATKDADRRLLAGRLEGRARIDGFLAVGIVALQGPEAVAVLGDHDHRVGALVFGEQVELAVAGVCCRVSRSGYTGEDGFELIVPAGEVEAVATSLLADDRVAPAGLGARDSLRLEAGLCLYGADLDETTSPIEAGLGWVIPKRRREAGDFPGADRILTERLDGPARRRVGLLVEGRRPVRPGATLADGDDEVGVVTSGTYGPTADAPIAMGYVTTDRAVVGTALTAHQRGRGEPVTVADLPFVPHRYVR